MSDTKNKTTRYSQADLQEFEALIAAQIKKAMIGHQRMEDQIEDITDKVDSDSDWMDESSRGNDLEMLYMMLGRSRKHIQDLENALLRIKNKSYGICIISGELIDKRRLLAVPTTTKSLQTKEVLARKVVQKNKQSRVSGVIHSRPKIISKVISNPISKSSQLGETDELNDFDNFLGGMAEDLINDGFDTNQTDRMQEE